MSDFKLKTLFWECTLRCNAFCEFCGSRCGEVKSDEVSEDEIMNTLSNIALSYDAKEIMINVTGGEPLLRRDLFGIMGKASELGFSWGMVTNGILIDDDVIKKMKQTGMKTVSVSLDGTKEIHEKLRGVSDCFEKITQGIKKLVEADFLNCVQVTTVVNSRNIGCLEQLWKILCELGVDSWRLAIVDPIGRAEENKELLLSDDELTRYFNFITEHRHFKKPDITTSCSHYLGYWDSAFRENEFYCATGRSVASILANGDIFVCPNVEKRKELIQGNIKTDSFVEKWEKGFESFRKEDRCLCSECEKCEHWHNCKGDSMHTWDFEKGRQKFCIMQKSLFDVKPTAYEELIHKMKLKHGRFQSINISYPTFHTKKIVFTPYSSEKLYSFFDWGKHTHTNVSEQMCGLYGHYMENLFVVEYVVPLYVEKRSEKEAFFSHNTYRNALEELEVINRSLTHPALMDDLQEEVFVLGGFAHSHPCELDAVMSVPDKELHDLMLSSSDTFDVSVILNPHKRSIFAFCGKKYTVTDIEIFTVDAQKWKII